MTNEKLKELADLLAEYYEESSELNDKEYHTIYDLAQKVREKSEETMMTKYKFTVSISGHSDVNREEIMEFPNNITEAELAEEYREWLCSNTEQEYWEIQEEQ